MKPFNTQTLASIISISLALPSPLLLANDQPQSVLPKEDDFHSFNDGDAKLNRVEHQILTELGCSASQASQPGQGSSHPDLLAERIARLDAVTYSHTLMNLALCYVEQPGLRLPIEHLFDSLYPKVESHLHHATAGEAIQTEVSNWKVYVAIIGGLLIAKRAVNSALAAQGAESGFFQTFARNFFGRSRPIPTSTGSALGDQALANAAARSSLSKDLAISAEDLARLAQSNAAQRAIIEARATGLAEAEAMKAGLKALTQEGSAAAAMQGTAAGAAARAKTPVATPATEVEAQKSLAQYLRDKVEPWKKQMTKAFDEWRVKNTEFQQSHKQWEANGKIGDPPTAPTPPTVEPPRAPRIEGWVIERGSLAEGATAGKGVEASAAYVQAFKATVTRDAHQSAQQAQLQTALDKVNNVSFFGPDAVATRVLQSRKTWIAAIAGTTGARLLWTMRNHKMNPRPVMAAAKITTINQLALKTYEISDLADALQEMLAAGAEEIDVPQAVAQTSQMDDTLTSVERDLEHFSKVEFLESLNDSEVKSFFEQDPKARQLLNDLVDRPDAITAQIAYARGVVRQIQSELNKGDKK